MTEPIPKWPDFKLEQSPVAENFWKATTDTGRPKTPLFTVIFQWPDAETAPLLAREKLDDVYANAHPNGCPTWP